MPGILNRLSRSYVQPLVLFASLPLALAAGCGNGNSNSDAGSTADLSMASTADMAVADPIAQGKTYAMMFGCVACHQSPNAADGVLSGQTDPRPMSMTYGANLTPDPNTGLGKWTDAQIDVGIRGGKDLNGRVLCGTMPRYGMLKDDQVKALIAYLRSIPAVKHAIPMSVCPPAPDGGVTDGGTTDAK